ncbi:MAG: glycoside hydrolase family 2 protein [Pyrinomonadaceae bacterium]|nr:glycoside hydrolase family 2 protein [Sphingobacteriaceae bacterium]
MRLKFFVILSILFSSHSYSQTITLTKSSFNSNWQFVKEFNGEINENLYSKTGNLQWLSISLPHTANIEPLVTKTRQWQGISLYRKFFTLPQSSINKHIAINFEGAMQEADIYLNGDLIGKHIGGYLPFYVDLTGKVSPGKENCILVKLSNKDNPIIPPGKPLADLDFNYYSGIYRNTHLIIKDKLHIPDAVHANRIAGGGVMILQENVTPKSAKLIIKTEAFNQYAEDKKASLRTILYDKTGKRVAQNISSINQVKKNDFATFAPALMIQNPVLWTPENPYLYRLVTEVMVDNKVTDKLETKVGIRQFKFENDGFYLNGKKYGLRGTNRHQEYPYIGNALSDEAQYRDAYKIKQAGFNFVRSSHYPQADAFLDACDELGIFVMNSIPGWQFVGNAEFQNNSIKDVRDMMRRDRNHPSIILWEASLNESRMPRDYMERAHKAVHEEIPSGDVYTIGWVEQVFDVYSPARQHGKAPDYWKKYSKKPLIIAEYGDWEYYAGNAGFNQKEFKDLKKEERSSRQLRAFGEKRLRQQALNYQESHNDNLKGTSAGDANWLMYDYNRGYANDLESSGIMDIFRLPKFSYYFYQSQVKPAGFYKPTVYIASFWNSNSDPNVIVYSNAEQVELFLNGKSLGKKSPDTDVNSDKLPHPPFTFNLSSFTPGTLKAISYIKGKIAAIHSVSTPLTAKSLKLSADISNKSLSAGKNDVVFVYACVLDKNGTVVPDASVSVKFEIVQGDAEIIGGPSIDAEAGIATVLLKAGGNKGIIRIKASAEGLQAGTFEIKSH